MVSVQLRSFESSSLKAGYLAVLVSDHCQSQTLRLRDTSDVECCDFAATVQRLAITLPSYLCE